MIDDTNPSLMFYPSNKTLSIGDKNVSGINIATGGGAFSTNTIKIGNASSAVKLGNALNIDFIDCGLGLASITNAGGYNVGTYTTGSEYSLTLWGGANDWLQMAVPITFTFRANVTYRLTISCKTNYDAGMRLVLQIPADTTVYTFPTRVTTSYQTFVHTFTQGSSDVSNPRFNVFLDPPVYSGKTFYWNLFKVEMIGTAVNGDLFLGTSRFSNTETGSYSTGMIRFSNPYGDVGGTINVQRYSTGAGSEDAEMLLFQGNDASDRIRLRAPTIRFDTYNDASYDANAVTTRMIINPSGNTAVGASYDTGKLFYVGGLCYAESGFQQGSDRRIKKNIVDVDDTSALDIVRKLKPKIYEYIDTKDRTDKVVYGFIAQEVEEVLNYAVQMSHHPIPNIMEIATVTTDTLTFPRFQTSNLERDSSGNLHKLTIKKNTDDFVTVLEILDEHTVRIDRNLTSMSDEGKLYIYGQFINDFHALNKDAIWTVTTAALQEVDRQVQGLYTQSHSEKEKTSLLQEQVETLQQNQVSLQQTCDLLQEENQQIRSKYDQLLQRILAIETK